MTYLILDYFVNLPSYSMFKMRQNWPFCRLSYAASRLHSVDCKAPLSRFNYPDVADGIGMLSVKSRRLCDCFFPLSFGFGLITQLRYADKRIVNIMKVYIERNNLQLELIRYRNKCGLYSRLLLRSYGFNTISPTEQCIN